MKLYPYILTSIKAKLSSIRESVLFGIEMAFSALLVAGTISVEMAAND